MTQPQRGCVLRSLETNRRKLAGMPDITIRFNERDTTPEHLERLAKELDITVEQLVKRFICAGVQSHEPDSGPATPGKSLEDFLVKNGVLRDS